MKKALTGKDAAILALFAQCSEQGSAEILSLLDDLSCEAARQIGQDIIVRNEKSPEAKAFLDWANENR